MLGPVLGAETSLAIKREMVPALTELMTVGRQAKNFFLIITKYDSHCEGEKKNLMGINKMKVT